MLRNTPAWNGPIAWLLSLNQACLGALRILHINKHLEFDSSKTNRRLPKLSNKEIGKILIACLFTFTGNLLSIPLQNQSNVNAKQHTTNRLLEVLIAVSNKGPNEKLPGQYTG